MRKHKQFSNQLANVLSVDLHKQADSVMRSGYSNWIWSLFVTDVQPIITSLRKVLKEQI